MNHIYKNKKKCCKLAEKLLHPTCKEAALSSKIKLMSKLCKNTEMEFENKIKKKLLLKRLSKAICTELRCRSVTFPTKSSQPVKFCCPPITSLSAQ